LVTVAVTHGTHHDAAAVLDGWNVAVMITVAFSVLGAVIVAVARAHGAADPARVPAVAHGPRGDA
jgi:hypothetical protein